MLFLNFKNLFYRELLPSRQKLNLNRGFTLIELIVVIGIIGVLTGMVTINLNMARERARDVRRKNDLKAVQKALEIYKNDQYPQNYPTDAEADLVTDYMDDWPVDPLESSKNGSWVDYVYTKGSGLTYSLKTCLENKSDPDKDSSNDALCSANGWSYTLKQP